MEAYLRSTNPRTARTRRRHWACKGGGATADTPAAETSTPAAKTPQQPYIALITPPGGAPTRGRCCKAPQQPQIDP
eukprot:328787-Prorocentrum_minimum.AAC.1